MSFETILLIIGGAVGLGILAYRTFSKQSAELKQQRLYLVQDVTVTAWHAVEGIARLTPSEVDDKVALALKRVAETISAQTGKPLTKGESALAELRLESLQAAKPSP